MPNPAGTERSESMAIIRKRELRLLDNDALDKRLAELRDSLNSELGFIAAGGKASNPGRIREMRKTIARILTIKHEKGMGIPATRPGSAG